MFCFNFSQDTASKNLSESTSILDSQFGREARKDLEEMLDNKVFLELWVKVKSGWADDERALRSLGYGED